MVKFEHLQERKWITKESILSPEQLHIYGCKNYVSFISLVLLSGINVDNDAKYIYILYPVTHLHNC